VGDKGRRILLELKCREKKRPGLLSGLAKYEITK